MSEVMNGGRTAENPTSPPQEESRDPDTPLRSEGNHETPAVKAEEEQNVTIPLEDYTRLMNLLGASLKARETEIIPNVFPLDPEPKEQDMQEKKAATKGEEAMMIHKLLENQRMILTALNPHPGETPVRTSKLFTGMTGRCSEQPERDSGYGPRITQDPTTTMLSDREENESLESSKTRFKSGNLEVEDDDGEETKEQSPVVIAVKKIEGLKEALEGKTSSRMATRIKTSMIEIVIGKHKFTLTFDCLFESGDGKERRATLNSMATIIEKEHKASFGSTPTAEATQQCLANGMKRVMTAAMQALGDALAEKNSPEATVAADAIQQDVEETRLNKFDLHAFASQGVGGIERIISIIARVIYKINPQRMQEEADQLEQETAKHCKLGKVNLVTMTKLQQQIEVLRAEGKTIGETLHVKDPITTMTALMRTFPSTEFHREHMLIDEFLRKIKDNESYIKRVEIAMAMQDQINRIREANASVRSNVPRKTDVLVATTTQTKSDEQTATGDSGTKPIKENKPNQRGVKRQEIEMKVVRKHGLCRKQLMNIIREKMTPKEAMEACQKGRNDGQCKFCKSCGEIKPEFVQMAKDILGSKDDEEVTAEQK